MSSKKEETGFITSLLSLLIVTLIFWLLWCWVVPQVWVGGPQIALHPGYWLTVGIVVILRFVRKFIFGIK